MKTDFVEKRHKTAYARCYVYHRMKNIVLLVVLLAGCTDSKVDACLDGGGSYNYEKCECDFEVNHEYKEVHSCK
jgi:hypothetical protein